MNGQRRHDEQGAALITVVLGSFAALTLVTASLGYALGSLNISRHDQDWGAALAAAEAGIDDFRFRISQDGGYWQYSAENPPPDGNLAFSEWVPVTEGGGAFRYDVDTEAFVSEGTIAVTSTGKVREVRRTVRAVLRKRTFLDYLYFTDYETVDPARYTGSPFTAEEAQEECAFHWYDGRDSDCIDISFITKDEINGPLHTNDAMLVGGNTKFNGDTSTSWNDPAGKRYRGSGNPSFVNAGDPKYVTPLTMPPSNTAIRAQADAAEGGTGCLYTGPTRVTLNSNGTMNVTSPFTKSSNCSTGSNLALPVNGVIFVQNVPEDALDPNYTDGCPYSSSHPFKGSGGFLLSDDVTPYGCRDGDAFLSGTLDGKLTIATEHNVIVTGHTRYASGIGGDDMLGLIANGYVEVYHPVKCSGSSGRGSCGSHVNLTPTFSDPVIHAAILAVQHSFIVQNYQHGSPMGILNVHGMIGQRYRGPVGTFSSNNNQPTSGYEKNYVYDQRLRWQSPPHFLEAAHATYRVATWAEIPPVHT